MATPHDSDAFYMQVHERLNAVPRGQLCLLLGDFNVRVGVSLLTALENMRQSLKTKMENGCVNCSLRATWSHSTLSSGDPYTWTKVAGRPARLDFICASTDLLAATRWAGVRKDIDFRVGSAEDHWLVVADVSLSIGESRENKRTQTVSIDRNLVHDQQRRVWNFQNHLEHVVLRDELEIGPLCSALTADVANAATACFMKGQDDPRKNWTPGNSWWHIKWAQSLRTDLRNVRANVTGMRLAVAFNAWRWTAICDGDADEWKRAASTSWLMVCKPQLHSSGLKVPSPRNVTV